MSHIINLGDKGTVIPHSDHRHYCIHKIYACVINMLICMHIHKICMPE